MRDRALGSTVRLKFTTTDSNGAPVAPSSAFAASDFRIYKDGSATEKATTNGITVTSPFDSVTGRHLIEIDTNNSTGDVGFWASGSAYFVELNTAKTVNSQSVSGLEIGSFSLELQTADIRKVGGTSQTAGDIAALIATLTTYVDTEVAAIKAKTDNLPSDPADASDIAASFVTVNTKLDTIDDFLDTEIAAIKAKTDNLPTDPADQSAVEAAITAATSSLATAAVQLQILDIACFNGAALYGACSDPQTSAETYSVTINGSTYTLDYSGQTSTGTRGTTTRTKT